MQEIWAGDRPVEELPVEIHPGEVVVVASGGAYAAVRVLTRTDIGRDAPLRLREIQGDLVLEVYNYLGQEKPFWEMSWPGAFYQGKPQCGFYFEMAERDVYPDGRTFGRVVASGELIDQAQAPFVYDGTHPRPWTVSYARDGQELGIEVDLMEWKLRRRWTQNGELGFPMLESAVARQSRSGEIRLGGAVLQWHALAGAPGGGSQELAPAWLFACPESGRWAAGYTGSQPVALSLALPGGQVEVQAMAVGTVVWDQGQVSVDAVGLQGEPKITI